MAVGPLIAPLPAIDLEPGMIVRFEAISPTTGLAIGGVTVSAISIYGETDDAGGVVDLKPGAFMLVPGPSG